MLTTESRRSARDYLRARRGLLNRLPAIAGLLALATTGGWAFARMSDASSNIRSEFRYSGLIRNNGTPMSGTVPAMSFAIYNSPAGGTLLHGPESFSNVPVYSGTFSVMLGSTSPLPDPVYDSAEAWLEIGIGGTILQPRQRITPIPMAVRAREAANGVPAGVVAAFAGDVPPPGWLLCDGHEYARSLYPTLFAAIGISSGAGDGVTTFRVPDYQGRFLRGVDHAANHDPEAATRASDAPGGNSGDAVGSIQGGSVIRHQHEVPINTPNNGGGSTFGSGFQHSPNTMWGSRSGDANYAQFSEAFGGAETRPSNVSVNYIIKY